MSNLAALRQYLLRHPAKLVLGISANFAMAMVGLVHPVVVGRAVDALSEAVSPRLLMVYGVVLVGVAALQGLLSFAQRMTLVALSRDVEYDLRQEYFGRLLELPLSFYQRSHTGDLMARGTNDLQAVRMVCGPAIMYSGSTIFTAVGALAFMTHLHGRLTLLALATMPLVAFSTRFFGDRIHGLFERVQEQFAALSTRVQENLAGVRVVRAYAREQSEIAQFVRANEEYVRRSSRLIHWDSAFRPLLQLLVGIGFVAVLWYGGRLVMAEELTVGEFVTFNFFLSRLVWPMIAIGWVINLAQRGSASLGRILEVLRTVPEIRDEQTAAPVAVLEGAVRFDHLDFSYASESTVLRDITLDVPAGTTLAQVGRTGSGKSTLLSLIPRLLQPPAGTVFIDGHDVRALPLASLRQAIAAVPQETILFSASVSENIALGRPEASVDDVLAAAAAAGLAADLEDFPQGLDTPVGERGIKLSGGQKQRVALARALLRRPRILLLDDSLSAVDTETEERILDSLRQEFSDRTVILVSHRLSTARHADQIVVLEHGRIAERGSHEELLEIEQGIYADLFGRQQLEDELAVV
ncbi:MAG: ABC transporter ATP-binding protein [Acidobacteria bacterium]|nr:ABC transporter ATP-binding protein [Acidobacteriota bacterium]